MNVFTGCSNYASDTCPCILAETGHCLVCSLCRGEDFCSCSDTVSYCVFQELNNNGGKAKDQHHIIRCEVIYEKLHDDMFKHLRLRVPEESLMEMGVEGSFVFVRVKENTYYDVPISVFATDMENNTIDLIIKITGVKTRCFKESKTGDTIFLRGPYHNGMLGIKNLYQIKNSDVLVVCKGIGLVPSLSIMNKLRENNNNVTVLLDRGDFSKEISDGFAKVYGITVREITICNDDGSFSTEIKDVLRAEINNGTGLVHFGLSDYLLKKAITYVTELHQDVQISCINNAHMCCGEGICGACTNSIGPDKIIHLCKEQIDPKEYVKMI